MSKTARTITASLLAVMLILTSCVSLVFAAGPLKPYTGKPHHYVVRPTSNLTAINEDTKVFHFKGDDKLDDYLASGGTTGIADTALWIAKEFMVPAMPSFLENIHPACSSIHVSNGQGGYLYGRNFDFAPCNGIIVVDEPTHGYKSVSAADVTPIDTTDVDKLDQVVLDACEKIPDSIYKAFALWVPLDGMNEKGLCISANQIHDPGTVVNQQDEGKLDHITTTYIRQVLDTCATVDEALDIIKSTNFHTWDGLMVHIEIADATGKHVVLEWVNNKLSILDSPINTNFYLTPGKKYGIGTAQSMIRYNTLTKALADHPTMDSTMLLNTMRSVAKSNFPDDKYSTQWTVIFDQTNLTATYYRDENYQVAYKFEL